ncbi:MAG: heme-binding protein [Clostridia bacterium]|nr:heme-binding protein [Clostridia bacterium]
MDKQQISEIVRRVMKENNLNDNKSEEKINLSEKSSKPQLGANVTLKMARKLIAKVIKHADEIGVKAVAAVVNSGARPVAVECADGSYIASYDIALGKAYTSASLKMKTSVLKELAAPGGSLYGIQHTNSGQIVIFGGGIPLKAGDEVIGGFGVSGGTEEQDTYLGDYAESVFLEMIADK